jgi:hypothetical protein
MTTAILSPVSVSFGHRPAYPVFVMKGRLSCIRFYVSMKHVYAKVGRSVGAVAKPFCVHP